MLETVMNCRVGKRPSEVAEAVAQSKTHLEAPEYIEPDSAASWLKENAAQQASGVRQAIFPVSKDLLAQLLALPEGAKVLGATSDPADPWQVRLVVEHEGLKPVPPGCPLPVVHPQYRERRVEKNVDFVGWGQSER